MCHILPPTVHVTQPAFRMKFKQGMAHSRLAKTTCFTRLISSATSPNVGLCCSGRKMWCTFFVSRLCYGSQPVRSQRFQSREESAVHAKSDLVSRGSLMAAATRDLTKPARALGEFFAMSLDTLVQMFRPPWAWREFLFQMWFVARVSLVPTILLTIPFTVLTTFIINILLLEIGAADFSGAGAALGTVTQTGPLVTVLVIAGAGATAMCADLGARTIREEIDALEVLGINPIQALVVPRVLAATLVSLLLVAIVTVTGLVGGFVFAVFFQNVTPGAFAAGLTLLVGTPQVVVALAKAAIFGLTAGLIACYKGLHVGGGPQGVGNAVNETVVFTFMALFVINVLATAVAVKATA
jgi:phospholipid/cholesterol/gamma-HCH transport system permease protein